MKDLIISHDHGFFSCSSIALEEIIKFHNEKKFLPTVDRKSQYTWYKDNLDQDVDNFFKERDVNLDLNPEDLKEDIEMESQFSDYSLLNFNYAKKIIDIYFSPCQKVKEIEENLIKKYEIDFSKTIAVYYRGNDKNRETTLASYDQYLTKIKQVINENPDHKILVESDELAFIDFIRNNIKDFIEIKESKKINDRNSNIPHSIDIGEKIINCQIFLAIVQILSKSDKVIINSGNVGIWICLYRSHINGIYQFLSNGLNSNEKTRNQKIGWLK